MHTTRTVTVTREFSSSSLHAFRVIADMDAPSIITADGTVRTFLVLGVGHHQGWTELVGWALQNGVWTDEVLETWEESLTDTEALATAEFLSAPYTIAA